MLFSCTGILYIQAPALLNYEARIVSLRAADLIYTRLSLILMYGRLGFVNENLSQMVVEFNAAGFDIIRGGLHELLETSCGREAIAIPGASLTSTVLSDLGEISFKV